MLPFSAGTEAGSGVGAPSCVRYRPEPALLYQIVDKYYPALKAHLSAQGADLPGYVQQEFENYPKCGRLKHGFLRVRCCAAIPVMPSTWAPSTARSVDRTPCGRL